MHVEIKYEGFKWYSMFWSIRLTMTFKTNIFRKCQGPRIVNLNPLYIRGQKE